MFLRPHFSDEWSYCFIQILFISILPQHCTHYFLQKHLKQYMMKKRYPAKQLQSFTFRHHNSQRSKDDQPLTCRRGRWIIYVWWSTISAGCHWTQLVLIGLSMLNMTQAHTDEWWLLRIIRGELKVRHPALHCPVIPLSSLYRIREPNQNQKSPTDANRLYF